MREEAYSFNDLIDDLDLITRSEDDEHKRIRRISRRMKLLLQGEGILTEAEKQANGDRYARHLMHVDRNRRFIVVSLVWKPGQGTPIHDHTTWGVAGIVEGELQITNYLRTDDGKQEGHAELRMAGSSIAPAGTVTYVLPPNEEIHRMENTGESTAISLHVYGKEISECNMFDEKKRLCRPWRLAYENARAV